MIAESASAAPAERNQHQHHHQLARAAELTYQGAQFQIQGNIVAARLHYDSALLLDPENPIALQNLAGALFASQQYSAAASLARRAIRAAPQNIFARANYGAALMHLGRYARARRELENVLANIDNDAGIWHNYSLLLYMEGEISAALEALNKSFAIQPMGPPGDQRRGDLGIFTLAQDLQRGLEKYETRWDTLFRSRAWDLGVSEWHGEDLNGKRLLFHHEQGFGDGIMLLRFARQLSARGAILTIAVPATLMRIAENIAPKARVVDFETDYRANFDYHTPMLSALRWLGIREDGINPAPYLKVPVWPNKIAPDGKLRIGICWESGDHSPILRARRRVVPLELFFSLAELPGARLISLQKGEAAKEILNVGAESFIYDPMGRVEDFYDTAKIIAGLDLVVSVDSAVAHLAGALGKPTIVLGPYTRCWRWWNQSFGLPWYREMRIFAQDIWGDWNGPMKRARGFVELKMHERTSITNGAS